MFNASDSTAPTVPFEREAYRDELNLAEFPLATIADSPPKGQETLEFADEIWDQGRREVVPRKLVISASDKYGLPTALDNELILGLIQVTSQGGFESRKVFFTRRELIKLLGWRDESKSYKRIEQSLNRWIGVTLYYDRAWWSKEEKCWVNKRFHILDEVELYDKERRERRLSANPDDPNAGKSWFTWNESVFSSFKSGNVKTIDLDLYRKLESAIAKQMYRFLDKHFWHRGELSYDLREFACEHIGLSRNHANAALKRQLIPAILELEEVGFLERVGDTERFMKKSRGVWIVTFRRAGPSRQKQKMLAPTDKNRAEIVSLLTARGIGAVVAQRLVTAHNADFIRAKVELFDWLVQSGSPNVKRNPAGFLVKAITEDYEAPASFAKVKKPKETPRTAEIRKARLASVVQKQVAERCVEQTKLDSFWSSLSEVEQKDLEEKALKEAVPFLAKQYHEAKGRRGSLFEVVRRTIIDAYMRKELAANDNAPITQA